MKSNVDLTIDRDFSSRRSNGSEVGSLLRTLNLIVGFLYPWSMSNNSNYNERLNASNEVLLTGDKHMRAEKRKDRAWDLRCSECNKLLRIIPWSVERISGCCNNCRREYKSFYMSWNKYPWENCVHPHKSLNITRLEDTIGNTFIFTGDNIDDLFSSVPSGMPINTALINTITDTTLMID